MESLETPAHTPAAAFAASTNGRDLRREVRESLHRPTIFISYSRRDARWLQRLHVHLKPLQRRRKLDLWDDTRIDAGEVWHAAIREAIDRAAAAILLISADFLASDFVASDELPPLLEKAEKAGSRIIPIIVQPCRLLNHPELARFQSLNPPTEPLSRLSDAEAEEVFARAVEEVERVLAAPTPRSRPIGEGADQSAESAAHGEAVFRDLKAATITLSLLTTLAGLQSTTDYTLSELSDAVDVRSRKALYEAIEQLARVGWVVKRRARSRTGYQIAEEGIRQLQRLACAADGPFRRDALP
jgi:hypothetical protein